VCCELLSVNHQLILAGRWPARKGQLKGTAYNDYPFLHFLLTVMPFTYKCHTPPTCPASSPAATDLAPRLLLLRLQQRHIIDLSVIIRLRNSSSSPAYSLVLSIPPLRRHITSHISYEHRCKIPWSLDFLSTYGTIYLWDLEQPLRHPYVRPHTILHVPRHAKPHGYLDRRPKGNVSPTSMARFGSCSK
jgi:hypothetical protein